MFADFGLFASKTADEASAAQRASVAAKVPPKKIQETDAPPLEQPIVLEPRPAAVRPEEALPADRAVQGISQHGPGSIADAMLGRRVAQQEARAAAPAARKAVPLKYAVIALEKAKRRNPTLEVRSPQAEARNNAMPEFERTATTGSKDAVAKDAFAKDDVAAQDASIEDSVMRDAGVEELVAENKIAEELLNNGRMREELLETEQASIDREQLNAIRNSVITPDEANDLVGALDTAIGKAVTAGNPKLVAKLEAEKNAIIDAQIAQDQRQVAAAREAAYEKAQRATEAQRAKDLERAHTLTTLKRKRIEETHVSEVGRVHKKARISEAQIVKKEELSASVRAYEAKMGGPFFKVRQPYPHETKVIDRMIMDQIADFKTASAAT